MTAMDQAIEKYIAAALVADLLKAGYALEVAQGDTIEGEEKQSKDAAEIMAEMFQCDLDRIYVYREGESRPYGWVLLVNGNGCDLISDYTVNLEEHLKRANGIADRISDGKFSIVVQD